MSRMFRLLAVALCSAIPSLALAQSPPTAVVNNGYTPAGKVQTRAASEISGSNWSVGAETMDRDYTIYDNWKSYLGPLGVKHARIQSGWAKTETQQGVYDWTWLDNIINDMHSQGVKPWVNLGYGNPVYPGGGGTNLGAGLPSSEAALAAWDNFVAAAVNRYKHIVTHWEVWNEPSISSDPARQTYANFLSRSAEVIKNADPNARVIAGGFAGVNRDQIGDVLDRVKTAGKLTLINEVSFHPYQSNPDSATSAIISLRNQINSITSGTGHSITLRQGENGAPSEEYSRFALRNEPWSEITQAKWNLRRMMGDLRLDMPSSIFSIIDMKYTDNVPSGEWNRKGLLLANDDQTVNRPKLAYYAVQHLTAIFDDSLQRIDNYTSTPAGTNMSLVIAAYEQGAGGKQVVTIWQGSDKPVDAMSTTLQTFTFANGNFDDPVYVDLLSGQVWDIPAYMWSVTGSSYTFSNVPIYDSVILIADRSLVPIPEPSVAGLLILLGGAALLKRPRPDATGRT
jgi:hypothetical protein